MDRARKKLLYPLLTQRWFNNCLLIKKNINSKYLMQWERNPKRWQKCAFLFTYDILYVSIKRTHQLFTLICVNCHYTLQHDTQMSSYYNDEYRNHLYKPFLSCLFKTRFRISFLASGVTHKKAQLMDHRPSGNDRQY